jgi:dinuclear metal center YbgI/SA1388 family protein
VSDVVQATSSLACEPRLAGIHRKRRASRKPSEQPAEALGARKQPERHQHDQELPEPTEERHRWAESLPNLRDFWQYIRAVVAPLSQILASLEELSPLRFAEAWDNVGLLLEPVPIAAAAPVSQALLTIDLSDQVVAEAEALGATLIIAYHPPIFHGLKRLRSSEPAERAILFCAARGIAIYSPHTALDAAPGGVNDWLLDAFGSGERAPCIPHLADARFGQGRGVRLATPLALGDAVAAIKRHLGLSQLRLAAAAQHEAGALVQSVAACAGAGGSVFEKLSGFDLYLTGEMRHHDVRARVLGGSSVVLCEHTNTERGFLPVLAERLQGACSGDVQFHVAACDRDPLCIV